MEPGHRQERVIQDIAGYCMSLGICKALYSGNGRILSHMPVSLYPYLIKASVYNKLKDAHYIWQKLFVKLSVDHKFVLQLCELFCINDPFMSRIFDIYKNTQNNRQKVGIACTRIDYMGDNAPQMVQFNLMSVGLNGMSDRVQNLHKMLNHYKQPIGKYYYPESHNQQTVCKALIFSLQLAKLTSGIIVMLVHDNQFNYGDHYAFRIQMQKRGRRAHPVTMQQLIKNMKYQQQTQKAFLNGEPIDAFYFRTGYTANHFPTQQHWKIRYQIQKSNSIKLPSIQMILINSKRFQSQLAKESVLKRYLNQEESQLLLSVAGQIYDFDSKSQQQILKIIEKTKNRDYVLKPNREGGGNNFFGREAHQKLTQLYTQKSHINNYILMKKIQSQIHQNYFIFQHKATHIKKVTGQYSTMGSFVYENGKIILNQMGGALARLKREEVNEGGIAINQGVISGVCIQNFGE